MIYRDAPIGATVRITYPMEDGYVREYRYIRLAGGARDDGLLPARRIYSAHYKGRHEKFAHEVQHHIGWLAPMQPVEVL